MTQKKLFIILGGVIIILLVYPLINMITSTSASEFVRTLFDSEVLFSLFLTFRASLWATLFALIFGIPLAYILARYEFSGKKLIEGIVDIPVIIPHSAVGIALLLTWGRKSVFGQITGLSIMGTEIAISAAMFFVAVPFLINNVKNGLKLVDPRYEKVALSLGASKTQVFFSVTLPMIRKSIISGSIMMWARGISEFGAVIILCYHPMIAPILIYDRYEAFGLRYAKPVAVLLIIICLIVFVFLRIFEDRKSFRDRG